MRKKLFIFVVLFMVMARLFSFSSAQVPKMINYQGKLTKAGTCALDTTISMTFKIYGSSGGSDSLWWETQNSVVVEEGIFNVFLGSVNPIPDSVFDGSTKYLGVKAGGDPEMTPRKEIVSVGYAFHAYIADTAYNVVSAGLVSVDGVSNPGDDVDLVQQNAITITPNDPANTITIGETHSARTDNPHQTTAAQTGALVSTDGVQNPGGNVDFVQQNAITITPNDPANTITIGETHSARTDNPHITTAAQTGALVSTDGVSNPGGNVDFIAGANMTITPSDPANTITFSSTINCSDCDTRFINTTMPDTISASADAVFTSINSYTTGTPKAIFGLASPASGQTRGVWGQTNSTTNYAVGVLGLANAGSGMTMGVYGKTNSSTTGASGVYGITSAGATYGVKGYSTSTTNGNAGVYGDADGGGICYGVYGQTGSTASGASGVYGYATYSSGTNYGVYGKTASSSGYGVYSDGDMHVAGDATITGSLTVSGVSMGKIYLTSDGTILSTRGGTNVLIWDKTNGEIEITNSSGDWCDYWWQAQKGATTSGDASATANGTSNVAIISGTNSNDYGFEVHFGQADGTGGWCSVWLQHANGRLVGHYIKY